MASRKNNDARTGVVVALIENRAREVGMASLDLSTGRLYLNQYIESSRSNQNTLTLLSFYEPFAIIVSANTMTAPEGAVGAASLSGDARFTAAEKVPLARACFDDVKGALLVQSHSSALSAKGLDSYHKQYYLSLGAAAAVFKWTEMDRGLGIAPASLNVIFNGSFNHLQIDSTSIEALEVIETASLHQAGRKDQKNCSLFGILNSTKTVGGTRLLKSNLLQPLKDLVTINTRLDCLDELLSKEEIFLGLSQIIPRFPKDLDKVVSHFIFKQKKVLDDPTGAAAARRNQAVVASIILLKESVEMLPQLATVLESATCPLLCNIREAVCKQPQFEILRESIEEVFDNDVLHSRAPFIARMQQCFAVKASVDGFLDVARRTFCETSEAIHALGKAYREDFSLPNLKLPFNNRKGFYIVIPAQDVEESSLPKTFIQVTRQGKSYHCTTQELTSVHAATCMTCVEITVSINHMASKDARDTYCCSCSLCFVQLNVRNREASCECLMRSELCLEDLCLKIRESVKLLSLLSESLSLLDMLNNSFAYFVSACTPGEYVRPDLTEEGPLAIDAGRHPFAERIMQEQYTPNNSFMSKASNLMLVTGPNMSGKSTYLRQVALITILAQVGMYVPAKFASLRLVDRIFTRLGTNDNLEANSSTFMTEMREAAFLTHNVTPRSLVLIDELGRATSTLDGLAIAWSFAEFMLSLDAYTILATHMQRLGELAIMYPNVKACYFSVAVTQNRLDFKYLLKEGNTNVPNYGLLLAEVAGMPPPILKEAREIAEAFNSEETKRTNDSHAKHVVLRKNYRAVQRLLCLQYSTLSEENVRDYLRSLKDEYLDGQVK